MSLMSNKRHSNNINESEQSRPVIGFLTHINELNIDSKKFSKEVDIKNFRKLKIFNPKDSNFPDLNDESSLNENKNPFGILKEKRQINDNNNNKSKEPKNKKKNVDNVAKKNKNKKNQNKKNKNSIPNNTKKSKSSSRNITSQNSTKRINSKFRIDTPEKYPEDYLSIDSSSEEETQSKNDINIINNNTNDNNGLSNFLKKKILEKEQLVKNIEINKEMLEELENFDIMAVDFKSTFRNPEFKKKFKINIIANIKITYFDKEQCPIEAVFVFCDKNGNCTKKENKLFPGAYSKNEFIKFCEFLKEKKASIKVELVGSTADMNKKYYLNWMRPNNNLYINFYFLVQVYK